MGRKGKKGDVELCREGTVEKKGGGGGEGLEKAVDEMGCKWREG